MFFPKLLKAIHFPHLFYFPKHFIASHLQTLDYFPPHPIVSPTGSPPGLQLRLVQKMILRAAVGNTSWVLCMDNGGDGTAGKVSEGPGQGCLLFACSSFSFEPVHVHSPGMLPSLTQDLLAHSCLMGWAWEHPKTISFGSLCSSAGVQTSFCHLIWKGNLCLLLGSSAGSAASRLKAKEKIFSSISEDSRCCRMRCGKKKAASYSGENYPSVHSEMADLQLQMLIYQT